MQRKNNSPKPCRWPLVLLFLLLLPAARSQAGLDHPNLLILNSYHQGEAWSDNEIAGVMGELAKHYPNLVPAVESLDTKRFPGPEHLVFLQKYLLDKYSQVSFDLILALDNPALELLVNNGSELFPEVPVVFAGINGYHPGMLTGRPNVTGVMQKQDVAGTVQLALALHPKISRILAIHDYTSSGLAMRRECAAALATMTDRLDIRYAEDRPVDDLRQELHTMPADGLVLILTYVTDRAGRTFTREESTRLITSLSPAPVYAMHTTYLGFGIVGGMLLEGEEHGRQAAEIAIRILQGEKPSQIPVAVSRSRPIIDYAVFKGLELDAKVLPADTIVINRPQSLWNRHRAILIPAFAAVALLLALSTMLVVLVIRTRRAERTLRESEANHKLVLAMMEESLSVIDGDGNFLLANATAARNLTGGDSENLIGKNIRQLVPEEQSGNLLAAYRQVLDGGSPMAQEVLISLPQGERWFHNTLRPLEYGERRIRALLSISLDISERKQAEEALMRQRHLLEKSQKMGLIGTWELDLAENRLVWTDENCRIFGVSEGSVVTYEIFLEKVHPEDRDFVQRKWQSALRGDPYDIEHRILLGEQVKWVREKAELQFDDDGLPLFAIGFTQDITERKLADRERQKLQAQLQQAQKLEAIGTLAGGIAHDFNNILGAIVGYAEMIRDDFPSGAPGIHDINQVLRASHRAKDLVKQILAFSRRVEDQKIPMQPAVIVKEAVTLLRSSLPTTITIKQDIDPDAGMVLADPTQIHQIVMNLSTNAFHAMEVKGGVLTISLRKMLLSHDDLASEPELRAGTFVQLSIKDTGVGIAPEIREKIFDPFFTTKEVGKGTGLGLSMVYSIVKSCQGTVICESRLGEGSEFRILLPALQGHNLQEKETADLTPHGKEHILLIDDEEILAELGQAMLQRLGYQVSISHNSLEALTIFQNQSDTFDLIITDQTMPGMTGVDLARRILQIRPEMPIILCTGYSSLISEDTAKAAGIKGFAYKPLAKKDIGELIRKVLDGKNP